MLPPLGDGRRNSKEQQVLAEVTNARTSDKSEEVTERFRRWMENIGLFWNISGLIFGCTGQAEVTAWSLNPVIGRTKDFCHNRGRCGEINPSWPRPSRAAFVLKPKMCHNCVGVADARFRSSIFCPLDQRRKEYLLVPGYSLLSNVSVAQHWAALAPQRNHREEILAALFISCGSQISRPRIPLCCRKWERSTSTSGSLYTHWLGVFGADTPNPRSDSSSGFSLRFLVLAIEKYSLFTN